MAVRFGKFSSTPIVTPNQILPWAAFCSYSRYSYNLLHTSAGFHPDPWAACVSPRRGGAPSVDGGNFWNYRQAGFCGYIPAVFSDVIHQVRGSAVADRKNSSLMCTP